LGICRPLPLFSMLVKFGATRATRGRTKWHGKRTTAAGVRMPHPSVRPGASKPEIL
jgi:hypothetical protein